jgi:hypothetical protein
MSGWAVLGVILVFVAIALAVRANRRLLVLRVDAGRIASARGRAPGELLHDFSDVFRRAGVSCRVALVVREGRVVVDASGPGAEAVMQQLRNVVGRFPVQRLRTAPRVARDR